MAIDTGGKVAETARRFGGKQGRCRNLNGRAVGFWQAAGLIASGLPLAMAQAQTKARPKPHTKPKAGPAKSSVRLNVRDFDAKGDGAAKDTLALQQALDRCAMLGGGEVLVPAGTYLIGAIRIGSNTILRLDDQATLMGSPDLADYPLTQVRWEGRWIKGYIGLVSALNADNIAVVGKGRIIGDPAIKSRVDPVTGVRHPALLEPVNCKGVRFEGLFTQQNDMWSIHPVYCEDISFRDMTVNGGADGIDIDSCKRVVIDGCSFATSDDCISLKSGRGMEGYVIARPTEDVRISNCTFNDLHFACMAIGSETSGGIRGVVVEHCKFLGCKTFAIYIKSRLGRGAFIEDITMTDLDISGAQGRLPVDHQSEERQAGWNSRCPARRGSLAPQEPAVRQSPRTTCTGAGLRNGDPYRPADRQLRP